MSPRKREELEEPFDYDKAYDDLASQMEKLHISRISEMPRVELYLDQVVSIVTMELAPLYDSHEKVVTGSMINNYVKQHIVPAPERKRYTSLHLASILFVCVAKRVLSIAQVAELLRMVMESDADYELAFDTMVELLEQSLRERFPRRDAMPAKQKVVRVSLVDRHGQPLPGVVCDLLGSCISLVADKVYLERMLDLEEHRSQATTD